MAAAVTHYRWAFVLLAVLAVAAGFYFNYVRSHSHWPLQAVYWISSGVTLATLIHWGRWKLL